VLWKIREVTEGVVKDLVRYKKTYKHIININFGTKFLEGREYAMPHIIII
jgi:hypothetical protein